MPGYPHRAQRLRAVQALGLRAGDSVVDIACGTGLNFPLIEEAIGPSGRIVGVDLTDAMLAQAQDRIERNGWSNISLVHADAADFDFPNECRRDPVHLRPDPGARVRRGHRPRRRGPLPRRTLGRAGSQDSRQHASSGWRSSEPRVVRPFASIDEWMMRRPWEAIRAAMQEELADPSWTELFFGTAFLAAGSRGLEPGAAPQPRAGQPACHQSS